MTGVGRRYFEGLENVGRRTGRAMSTVKLCPAVRLVNASGAAITTLCANAPTAKAAKAKMKFINMLLER